MVASPEGGRAVEQELPSHMPCPLLDPELNLKVGKLLGKLGLIKNSQILLESRPMVGLYFSRPIKETGKCHFLKSERNF